MPPTTMQKTIGPSSIVSRLTNVSPSTSSDFPTPGATRPVAAPSTIAARNHT
jgi:hypothetical protein